eukprot:gnl/TRDRNA2_/TRDRNA2_158333_c0_seq3.p1 gnl/TRDRNA2_/TRDRNA2_158333_c0~~gnl/TRDRNA2_/TRDRNA2_158333_c0_seq3.p1  ORF type:complete len:247 (+),score=37.26 gnl/TRDRNA2_/TRDRNA2_158333_c0_seq3:127-867(+)
MLPATRGARVGHGTKRWEHRDSIFRATRLPTHLDQRSAWPTEPVPCRDDLAVVAEQNFHVTGVAAEVGVYQGEFAAKNLRHWSGTYFLIDAWAYRKGDALDDKNFEEDQVNEANREAAIDATAFAGERVKVLQEMSPAASRAFEDGTLDWVYIDAVHTYEALLVDLAAWFPKVRQGGLISGDDYADAEDTTLLTRARSERLTLTPTLYNWGTIRAVNEFTRSKGIQLFVTWLNDCYNHPAWYFVKP